MIWVGTEAPGHDACPGWSSPERLSLSLSYCPASTTHSRCLTCAYRESHGQAVPILYISGKPETRLTIETRGLRDQEVGLPKYQGWDGIFFVPSVRQASELRSNVCHQGETRKLSKGHGCLALWTEPLMCLFKTQKCVFLRADSKGFL